MNFIDREWNKSAAIYSEVAPKISFYRETTARLVLASSPRPGMLLADIAAGSAGILEDLILHRQPEVGAIYCIDQSAEMLKELRRKLQSDKIITIHSRVEQMSSMLPQVDSVICNAGVWNFSLPLALQAIRRTLNSEGRFLFTISEWDLDYWGALRHPKYDLIESELRARGLPPKPARGSIKKLNIDDLKGQLDRSGFRRFATETFDVDTDRQDYKLFYSIPAIVAKSLPNVPHAVAREVLAAAMDRLPETNLPPIRWMLVEAGVQ